MSELNEPVRYYSAWRKRLARLCVATCCGSFIAVTTAPMPVAANGMMVPICTNGAISYVLLSFDDDNAPPPDGPAAACHGPCLHERKRPLTEKNS